MRQRLPLLLAALAFAGCASPTPQNPPQGSSASGSSATPDDSAASLHTAAGSTSAADRKDPKVEPIGQAKMLDDGTIVLDLFRPAMVQKKYAPGDPDYASILEHVGPLAKGETKAVAPWPDDIDDAKVAAVVGDYVKANRKWSADAWTHEITGTDADGNVVVTVKFKKDFEGHANEGGQSFQVRLAPKTYAFVREVRFQ